jgi:hypothetical protein
MTTYSPPKLSTGLFAARAIESDPCIIGASTHLLMVARRPTT